MALSCQALTYSSFFPVTENPISEALYWTNGGTVGIDWTNMQTSSGKIYGTQASGAASANDADSTAILSGSWGPAQTVTAQAFVLSGGSGTEEIEIRLRTKVSAHSITGYEIDMSCHPGTPYLQIVRWNGALKDFNILATTGTTGDYIHDGEIVEGTISGSTISLYTNGVLALSFTDSTWTSGSPGAGAYLEGTVNNSDYGFTWFTATDGVSSSVQVYVDGSAGNDGANGLTTSTPWLHSPCDVNATKSVTNMPFIAGSTAIFKGGSLYTLTSQTNIVPTPGTSYTTNGSWGSGYWTFTGQNISNCTAMYQPIGMTNIFICGMCCSNLGNTNTLPSDGGSTYAPNGLVPIPGYGLLSGFANNVTNVNCKFTKLGYWQNVKPIGNGSLAGDAIQFSKGQHGLIVSNCDFSLMRDPIQLFGGGNPIQGLIIASNSFHENQEWSISILCTSTNDYRTNVDIYGNTFFNSDQFYNSAGLWTGYGEGPHENNIMMFGLETCGNNYGLDRPVGDTNVFIHHNLSINTSNNTAGSQCFWVQDSTSAHIYDNVFNNTHQNNQAINVSEPSTNTPWSVDVAFNTVYSTNPAVAVAGPVGCTSTIWWWAPVASGRLVKVLGNVFSGQNSGNNNYQCYKVYYSTNNGGVAGSDFTQFTNNVLLDFNDYFSDQGYPQANMTNFLVGGWQNGGALGHGLSICINQQQDSATIDSRVLYQWDLHSHTNWPGFKVASWVHAENNDLSPSATSPILGTATNLSALNWPMITIDAAGNTRPATGNWTPGAFESTASPTPSAFAPAPFR